MDPDNEPASGYGAMLWIGHLVFQILSIAVPPTLKIGLKPDVSAAVAPIWPRGFKLDLTQAIVADRLDVTQENVSQIERGEADVRLSTLNRYVEALGGRLEVRAAFPKETISLSIGKTATVRRRRTRPGSPAVKTTHNPRAKRARKTATPSDA